MSKVSELENLLREQAALEERIEAVRAQEKATVLSEVKEKIAAFQITAAELGFSSRGTREAVVKTRKAVAALYRDPDSGKTWSGRGKPPLWIAGQDRSQFTIDA